jgi:hypothetical protein
VGIDRGRYRFPSALALSAFKLVQSLIELPLCFAQDGGEGGTRRK